MQTDPSEPTKAKPSSNALKYSGLGIQLLVTIGICAWIGHLIDQYLELKFPVFLLLLMLAAFGGNMYILYKSASKD